MNFWRTKDKAEVDFVFESGKTVTPLEVKYKQLRQVSVPASLRSFILKYHPKSAYVINLSLRDTAHIDDTKISFLPFNELLRKKFVL